MLDGPTIEKLKEMRLKVMAEMLSDPDSSLRELSFEDRLALMVEKQWLAKRNARIKRLIRDARFPIDACIEDIRYHPDRTIDKKTVSTLSTCTYIEKRLNGVVSGRTGSGKSFIICALGNAACRKLYQVKYYRIPELLLEIEDARESGMYLKFMRSFQKVRLLILDDIGLKSYTIEESRDILEIAESRYNRASTILSAQVEHSKWYDLFADPTIADAIMDRIIHNAYVLPLDSKKSMRQVMAEEDKGVLN
ncbi:MAG: IS21-like element helper ATPase IstB [Actinobacteria bacterium]|nr:IS21-like element helper ATPase IstB [Actinomycetota bacterium]